MSSTTPIRLTGLDPQDPLAYLATLGCLLAATESCRLQDWIPPKLRFEVGTLAPVLDGPFADEEALLEALLADLERVSGRAEGMSRDPFLEFRYEDDKGNSVQDLKPQPGDFRAAAQSWIEAATLEERRTVDWAAAVLTDVAVDGKGAAKPFALHFTAGNQKFLVIANELLDGPDKGKVPPVGPEDLRAAVFGPWPNDRPLKVFSWSPTQDRAYALRAVDPASDQKLGTPGADWLALRGLALMSSAPQASNKGGSIHTSGVRGGWKSATFSYPVWPVALDADAVRSLLRHPSVREDPRSSRIDARTLPRGVEILTCRISRSDQGGYGAFSRPSRS
jgi:hypothetical protein